MKSSSMTPRLLALSIGVALAFPLQAQNLVELYEAARPYDAGYKSARSQFDANVAKADQALAGILPSAGLSMGISRTNIDANIPLPNTAFGAQSATVVGSQPLYRPANRITYAQGRKSIEVAQAQLTLAEQDLIVRVSQAYFDVLAAQDNLTFVNAQKVAVAEQLASAKRNFEVGTSTITDTREAQARYDLVIATEIAADNDLRVKKIALDQLVGRTNVVPKPLAAPVTLPPLLPADVNLWVLQSEQGHPSIRQAELGLEVARMETQKAKAANLPTVDLNGSYGVARNEGSSTATSTYRTNVASVGVALNMPLFAGYAIQNRIKETLSLEEKAGSDLDAAKRAVAQGTRTAYFGVLSGQGQVKALEAAEVSTQSALDANKLGYQVGVRINIDVLNSQSQLFQTKRDLAKARYDVLVGGLRLRQANGSLQSGDLQAVNTLLAK